MNSFATTEIATQFWVNVDRRGGGKRFFFFYIYLACARREHFYLQQIHFVEFYFIFNFFICNFFKEYFLSREKYLDGYHLVSDFGRTHLKKKILFEIPELVRVGVDNIFVFHF